jgi:uncharacterized protein
VTTATLDELRSKRAEILQLARAHKATRVRLFGSVVRGQQGENSDVDFLVDFEPGASTLDQVGLLQGLTELLGVPVDVISTGGLGPRHEGIRQEAVDL